MKRVLIVDGNNLAYRCKHVFALTNGTEDVSVSYGFLKVLQKELRTIQPDAVVVCWDGGIPKFRKDALKEYKAGRHKKQTKADRENFLRQIGVLQANLHRFGIVSVTESGIEADDLIYHLTKMLTNSHCIVYSNDHDLFQTITPDGRVSVRLPNKELEITSENFEKHVGVKMSQFMDYKVMLGDDSDNIKGIKGIGEKMAKGILTAYGNLDSAMTAVQTNTPWKAAKLAKTRMTAVDPAYIANIRKVMQLGIDAQTEALCKKAITEAIARWAPFQALDTKKWLFSKAFTSLLDGKLQKHCRTLVAPELPVQKVAAVFDKTKSYEFPIIPRKWIISIPQKYLIQAARAT